MAALVDARRLGALFIAIARAPARSPAAGLHYCILNSNSAAVTPFSLTQGDAPCPLVSLKSTTSSSRPSQVESFLRTMSGRRRHHATAASIVNRTTSNRIRVGRRRSRIVQGILNMIGAPSLSCRVQSAASWSKRPPSSCCRWRLPDAPWLRRRDWPRIPHSRLRATPGMAPVRIPTGCIPPPGHHAQRVPLPGRSGTTRRTTPIRTLESTGRWSSAKAVSANSLSRKTLGWPEQRIEPPKPRLNKPRFNKPRFNRLRLNPLSLLILRSSAGNCLPRQHNEFRAARWRAAIVRPGAIAAMAGSTVSFSHRCREAAIA